MDVEERTGKTPPALLNEPELFGDLQQIWDGFEILNRTRPALESSLGSIPLSEIESYLRLNGITGAEDKVEFTRLIIELDIRYLKLVGQQREQNRGRP